MLTALAIDGYRSIRRLRMPLGRITVVTGANGSGKSNLYRALRLLAAAGRDGSVAALAAEGGLPSTLWAGPETIGRAVREGSVPIQPTVRRGPVALRLGFASYGFGYAMDLGVPIPSETMFDLDPEIKLESVWHGAVLRPSASLAERRGPHVRLRDEDGWRSDDRVLAPWTSMLDEVDAPELRAVRSALRTWRFYDHVRTDQGSPARSTRLGTRTPLLAADGGDLAAAIQTIREIGSTERMDAAIEAAFPGSRVRVEETDGRFRVRWTQPNLLRALTAEELSDGTLSYLIWVAALLAPRPAPLSVLNEPETSLHPDLLAPLAELIVDAADESQVIVVTHAAALTDALTRNGAAVVTLHKPDGETLIAGQKSLDEPPWHWPSR